MRNKDTFLLEGDNMFLAGDSSGAYLAAMAACILSSKTLRKTYHFHTNVVCRAIALNSGMYDFTTLLGKDVSFPMKRKMAEMLFGMHDYEKSEGYSNTSVLHHVNEKFPPVYLMDTQINLFEKEALRLSEVLKEYNISYQLRIFDKSEKLKHSFNILSKYPQSGVV